MDGFVANLAQLIVQEPKVVRIDPLEVVQVDELRDARFQLGFAQTADRAEQGQGNRIADGGGSLEHGASFGSEPRKAPPNEVFDGVRAWYGAVAVRAGIDPRSVG